MDEFPLAATMQKDTPIRCRQIVLLGAFLGTWLCACAEMKAQTKPTEAQVKAAYLYNFGRYVKWPPNPALDRDHSFPICVFGQDPLAATLTATVSGEMLNGRAVAIRHIDTPQEASNCRILFLYSGQSSHLRELLSGLDRASILTVSDMPDFLQQGGMIQFVLERDSIRFKVDLSNVSNAHLTLSSELLRVAAAVQGSTRPGGK